MFTLELERGKYLRVREGTDRKAVEETFGCPVTAPIFEGAIVVLPTRPRGFIYALPGDTFASIARREGADEESVAALNGGGAVYPTRRIWLP